jgi:hypothetical protein
LFDEDSLIMANIGTFATVGFLLTLGAEAFALGAEAFAMPPQEILAEAKSCMAIADDKERLKCFDGVFGAPAKPQPEGMQGNWSIDESKSPNDSSPQVVAANLVGDIVLILRCKDQITEAAFSTQFNYLGYKSVDVELRINDRSPIKEVWKASMNGRAAFAPDAIAFIQSLPDSGRLSIKATRSTDGKAKEGKFDLGAVSEVRNKIAKACNWTDVEEPVGSIDHQEKH